MEKRTAEIIMVLKGNHNLGEHDTLKQYLIAYMSNRCYCSKDVYTDELLYSVVKEAIKDTMSHLSSPGQIRAFLYSYFEARMSHDELDSWLVALQLMQVRENGEYINGFTEENTKLVRKI